MPSSSSDSDYTVRTIRRKPIQPISRPSSSGTTRKGAVKRPAWMDESSDSDEYSVLSKRKIVLGRKPVFLSLVNKRAPVSKKFKGSYMKTLDVWGDSSSDDDYVAKASSGDDDSDDDDDDDTKPLATSTTSTTSVTPAIPVAVSTKPAKAAKAAKSAKPTGPEDPEILKQPVYKHHPELPKKLKRLIAVHQKEYADAGAEGNPEFEEDVMEYMEKNPKRRAKLMERGGVDAGEYLILHGSSSSSAAPKASLAPTPAAPTASPTPTPAAPTASPTPAPEVHKAPEPIKANPSDLFSSQLTKSTGAAEVPPATLKASLIDKRIGDEVYNATVKTPVVFRGTSGNYDELSFPIDIKIKKRTEQVWKESDLSKELLELFKLQYKSQAQVQSIAVNDDDVNNYADKYFADMYEYYSSKYDERQEAEDKKALDTEKENEAFETLYKQSSNDLSANILINLNKEKLIDAEFIQLTEIKKMLQAFKANYRRIASDEVSLIGNLNYDTLAAEAYGRFRKERYEQYANKYDKEKLINDRAKQLQASNPGMKLETATKKSETQLEKERLQEVVASANLTVQSLDNESLLKLCELSRRTDEKDKSTYIIANRIIILQAMDKHLTQIKDASKDSKFKSIRFSDKGTMKMTEQIGAYRVMHERIAQIIKLLTAEREKNIKAISELD
jgi:hypothetical protein